jgi:hypothetical protein
MADGAYASRRTAFVTHALTQFARMALLQG